MIGYLSDPKTRLVSPKAGMQKNSSLWTDQTLTIQKVDEMIASIDTKDNELEESKNQYQLKITGARNLSNDANNLADKIENLAYGFHGDNPEKLIEYNIKKRKASAPKPVPTKVLIPTLADDSDGEGFVVSTQVDPNADYYEWQKGLGTNAADANTIPELKNFKTTKKTNFVDDEVPKGVRVFYRVRAANTNGVGPWSEAVSKVQ